MINKIKQNILAGWEKIQDFWDSLKPRERILVGSTFIVLGALFFLQVGIISPVKKIREADKAIAQSLKDLTQLNTYHKQYQSLKRRQIQTRVKPNRSNQESLLAILEKVSVNNNIKSNVRYMRPATVPVEGKFKKRTVEIKIESAQLPQLLKFMYDAENYNTAIASEYYLLREAYNKPGYYDLTIRFFRMEKS